MRQSTKPTSAGARRFVAAIDVDTGARRTRVRRLRGLYAVTPDNDDTTTLIAQVAAALEGGAAAIQYRNKSASEALREAQAFALARLHAARGGLLIVNDDAALAAKVGADGVHIGSEDGSVASARALIGPDRIVGVSCYDDFDCARRAVEAGADYVAFGSFFLSSTKPGARRAPLALLEEARSLDVPIVAIGGIDADNARTLVDAGADAVAMISAIFKSTDAQSIRDATRLIASRISLR